MPIVDSAMQEMYRDGCSSIHTLYQITVDFNGGVWTQLMPAQTETDRVIFEKLSRWLGPSLYARYILNKESHLQQPRVHPII